MCAAHSGYIVCVQRLVPTCPCSLAANSAYMPLCLHASVPTCLSAYMPLCLHASLLSLYPLSILCCDSNARVLHIVQVLMQQVVIVRPVILEGVIAYMPRVSHTCLVSHIHAWCLPYRPRPNIPGARVRIAGLCQQNKKVLVL